MRLKAFRRDQTRKNDIKTNMIRQCLVLPQRLVAVVMVVYLSDVWWTHTRLMASGDHYRLADNITTPMMSQSTPVHLLPAKSTQEDDRNDHTIVPPSNADFPLEPIPRPPLESIVQGWNITGDASWLLNVAIIGFPKTGTTTLMKYLHKSRQVHIFDEERCEMTYNHHARLTESLYRDIPPGRTIRGIKCPRDVESKWARQNYQTFFPKTDFMVGLRHPVLWFESFYNFKVDIGRPMKPAETLTGRCYRQHQGVCTFRGNFHLFLANLGKTNILSNPAEMALIPREYHKNVQPIPLQGRIFLWEVSQLQTDQELLRNNNNHSSVFLQQQYKHSNLQFRQDLQQFLRLDDPLPEMIKIKPGKQHPNNQIAQRVSANKIDICQPRYEELREILMRQSKLAATWIREYFLDAPGVYVSQKEHFSQVILKRWEQDPCDFRNTTLLLAT
ncbi:expressed unknown protein [Seminavis robusta]|uniref:Sulfotransferase domain-containing protein n=1 Tax=Seminavis robusta TaxID=568900 RepID=A0A9N8EYB4_9STRA|nr:expressed unknown protein [Seminavis robusta]|eukprot:Sro2263_g321250.1 n/a (444) ;mRNA; f:11304-12635